jgi:tetratricopeptide (TPR) repeat protein
MRSRFQIFIAIALYAAGIQFSTAAEIPQICPDVRGPSVLVGPFTISGAPRQTLDQEFGNILTYSVISWLSASHELTAVPWTSDPVSFEMRQISDLSDLLQAPLFYNAKPKIEADKEGFRRVTSIANALKIRGCNFLFGGSIIFEGPSTLISAYILDTENSVLSRPSGPFYYDRSLPIAQLGASLAKTLLQQLKPVLLSPRKVEVGCLRLIGSASDSASVTLAQKLAKVLQETLVESLERTPGDLQLQPSHAGICEGPEAEFTDGTSFALLTGDINVAGAEPVFTPRIRLNVHDVKDGFRSVPISLAPATFNANRFTSVARNYVEQALLFFDALDYADTTVSDLTELRAKIDDTSLFSQFMKTGTDSENPDAESLLMLGYRSLSRQSLDPLSFAILGSAFAQKGKFELAAANLTRAIQLLNSSTQVEQQPAPLGNETERTRFEAHCLELLAVAQSGLGYFQAADDSTRRAVARFRQIQDADAVARVVRVAAQISLKNNQVATAIQLLKQDSSTETNYKNLILLGSLLASDGKLEDATSKLDSALHSLDRSDSASRSALGDAFEAIGDQWLIRNSNTNARSNFIKALQAREAQRTHYKLAFAAMTANDFASAEGEFNTVIASRREDDGRWLEAAWLQLLEVDLLMGKFAEVVAKSNTASEALRGPGYDDARLFIEYVRLIARALIKEPPTPDEQLQKELVHLRSNKVGSISNLKWNSENVDKLIAEPQSFLGPDHPYSLEHMEIIRQARSSVASQQ